MAEILAFGVLILLILLGLQRNHVRQRYHPTTPAGGTTAADRDAERVAADLMTASTIDRAVRTNQTSNVISMTPRHVTR